MVYIIKNVFETILLFLATIHAKKQR